MKRTQQDIAVIGAGLVGLAAAYKIHQKFPEANIYVIEKESGPALHQSTHNSGVIHSGIYYKPGSLKAKNCIKGYNELIEFCDKHQVDYDLCGKVIVATNKREIPTLKVILEKVKIAGNTKIETISETDLDRIRDEIKKDFHAFFTARLRVGCR